MCFSTGNLKSLDCLECKLIYKCKGSSRKFSPKPELPSEIIFELTTKCNLDCEYCYNTKKDELETDDVKKIIDKISKSEIKVIRLTGGEPTLKQDLLEIIRHAKKRGLYTILNTNGTLNSNKTSNSNGTLIKYEKTLDFVDEILLSVHSLKNKSKIEYFIGKRKLNCCTVLTKENIKKLESFYLFFSNFILKKSLNWFLLRPVPTKKNTQPITIIDMQNALKKIYFLNKKYNINITIKNAVPYCCYDPKITREICEGGVFDDGRTLMFIDAEGKIKPSYFLDIELGDATKDSLLNAWNSEIMYNLRRLELIPAECILCEFKNECMGGLRGAAYFSRNLTQNIINNSSNFSLNNSNNIKNIFSLDPFANPKNLNNVLNLKKV